MRPRARRTALERKSKQTARHEKVSDEMATSMNPMLRRVLWAETSDTHFPYTAQVGGERWTLRINDFPDEPLYTLFVGQRPLQDIEEWPSTWVRPTGSTTPDGAHRGPLSPPQ